MENIVPKHVLLMCAEEKLNAEEKLKDYSTDSFFVINQSVVKPKIAAFDLDWTLVKPNKGVFPKDKDDWVPMHPNVKEKLQQLHNDDYSIVVFTNQSKSDFNLVEFTEKINNISTFFEVPLTTYGCTKNSGKYRKPATGMWDQMTLDLKVNLPECFYIGDAAGRPKDFSDSDYKFALNIGIKFQTPEEFFSYGTVLPYEVPKHPMDDHKVPFEVDVKPSGSQEMLILIGPPASTKSSFCKQPQFKDYVVVNQDILGTKLKVISSAKKAIQNGDSVIIDRMNEHVKNRAEFIKLAHALGIPSRIIWFKTTEEVSKHLAAYREITEDVHIPAIVYNKYYSKTKGFEPPTLEEGVKEIIEVPFFVNYAKVSDRKTFDNYLT